MTRKDGTSKKRKEANRKLLPTVKEKTNAKNNAHFNEYPQITMLNRFC